MKKSHYLCALVPVTMLGLNSFGQLSVTQSSDAAALASLLVGSGVTVTSGTEVLATNVANGAGSFTGGSTLVGINEGLILSTGNVLDAPGPNSSGSITGGGNSTSLSFDFTTDTGDLFFNYVFASDEYLEYVNSQFNDLFELRVDGVNIALLPDNVTPVEVNTVNHLTNSTYFVNNSAGAFNIEYDGFTTVLTAKALGLAAGSHTIEFLVQDLGDSAYDSAVFVKAGSFSSVDPTVPEPSVIAGISVLALFAAVTVRRRRKATK